MKLTVNSSEEFINIFTNDFVDILFTYCVTQ